MRSTSLVGILAACLLAGCGSKNDSEENAVNDTSSAPAASATSSRGVVESVTNVAVVTRSDSDAAAAAANFAALAGPAICDVQVQLIVHGTIGPDNETAKNSAALFTPRGAGCNGPFPLIAYARGTSRERGRTLADPLDREASLLINIFAARGFIVVATNYLGYAGSDFPNHPYLNASSEAASVIDSIRAARAVFRTAATAHNGKIFLAGYSQGGHAALAAQREIERTTGSDIALTAVGAMSGPYDLALTLNAATATVIPSIADESATPVERVRMRLVGVLADVAGFFGDLGPVRDLFARNSVVDFKPVAPLMLCGGARDRTVPFENSRAAAAAFSSRGARVTLVDIDQEPAYAAYRPAPDVPASELSSYHNRVVPPLCFQAVRDRMFLASP